MRLPTLLVLLSTQVFSFVLETKLDLPYPSHSSFKSQNDLTALESNLSPKLVKAFYEINFIPVDEEPKPKQPLDKTVPNKAVISDPAHCPYSKELCNYYFSSSKVSVVQKVEEMIDSSKKDGSIPVIQGLVARVDQESFFKELNDSIMANVNKVVNITSQTPDIPVYRGTVNVDEVLKRPEISLAVPTYPREWTSGRDRRLTRRCVYEPCFPGTSGRSSLSADIRK